MINVKNLKSKEKRYTIKLGNSLFLRVYPSGIKSYVLRYSCKGIVKDYTLGHYPSISVLQAKHLAKLKRDELNIKPIQSLTFKHAFTLWQNKKRNIKSFKSESDRIKNHLLPYLSNVELDKITAPFALNIILKIQDKPATLKRMLMRLNEILELAVCAGVLSVNPCRKLSKLFAPHVVKHRSFIHHSKLYKLFSVLEHESLDFQIYVLFCVYSALRPKESVILKWSYIKNDTLTVPREHMKAAVEHRIFLTKEILYLLKIKKKLNAKYSRYIFKYHKQHLSRWLLAHGFRNILTHHGLRSTFRTFLAENNAPFEIGESALAHQVLNKTQRAYLHTDFLEQRKEYYQKWCNFILTQYCAHCAQSKLAKLVSKRFSQ